MAPKDISLLVNNNDPMRTKASTPKSQHQRHSDSITPLQPSAFQLTQRASTSATTENTFSDFTRPSKIVLPSQKITESTESRTFMSRPPPPFQFGIPASPKPATTLGSSPFIFGKSHKLTSNSPLKIPTSTGSSHETPSSSESGSSETDSSEHNSASIKTGLLPPIAPVTTTVRVRAAAAEGSRLLAAHLCLLNVGDKQQDEQQLMTTPIFTHAVLKSTDKFSQYGFLAGDAALLEDSATMNSKFAEESVSNDPRLYFNIAAPSSAFICGSQGSGKSHTLSCLLENCLMKSDVSMLNNPLAGLVFHYDSFTSDVRGTPCEAAYLSSDPKIKVRVLCSPTNIETIKRTYAGLNVTIEALQIDQTNLSTKRMLDLMAVNPENGPMPLYLHSINRILREMRIEQQARGGIFNYGDFKRRVELEDMTPAQKAPLAQRLDTLESFMHQSQTRIQTIAPAKKMSKAGKGNDWTITPGNLTIVDLSCPCMTSEGACALFNICLGIFLEQTSNTGRIIALDEAHKYMNTSTESATLTETLLSAVRLQRHLGARVFISTQEPTISPVLLDLCTITIVHRFSSPEWLRCLRLHIAALDDVGEGQKADVNKVFSKIVRLRVGEALLFAPSAIVGLNEQNDGAEKTRKLGTDYLRVRVRGRITHDGGRSTMAR